MEDWRPRLRQTRSYFLCLQQSSTVLILWEPVVNDTDLTISTPSELFMRKFPRALLLRTSSERTFHTPVARSCSLVMLVYSMPSQGCTARCQPALARHLYCRRLPTRQQAEDHRSPGATRSGVTHKLPRRVLDCDSCCRTQPRDSARHRAPHQSSDAPSTDSPRTGRSCDVPLRSPSRRGSCRGHVDRTQRLGSVSGRSR